MQNQDAFFEMENLFTALSDKTRLRLLNLMRDHEVCVCFFTEVLDESQPKISRHLAYLRNAGIVSARRDGKWIHYSIEHPNDPYAAKILHDTLEWLKNQESSQSDYEKLEKVCCSTDAPVTISRAPKPDTFAKTDVMINKREEMETFLL